MTTGKRVGRGIRAKPGQAKAWRKKVQAAMAGETPTPESQPASTPDALKSKSTANPRPDDERAILIHALQVIWGACERHTKVEGICKCACVIARESLQVLGIEPLNPAWAMRAAKGAETK